MDLINRVRVGPRRGFVVRSEISGLVKGRIGGTFAAFVSLSNIKDREDGPVGRLVPRGARFGRLEEPEARAARLQPRVFRPGL